jgi:hypothetical protein
MGFEAFAARFDQMTKISNFTPVKSCVLPSLIGSWKCIHLDNLDEGSTQMVTHKFTLRRSQKIITK